MTTIVSFRNAKLLKEKGYDFECENFYSKNGELNYLKPYREYEHLHSYSKQLVWYFDGKHDWNSLDVDEGMIALKTAFSESDGYVNCECSAPTIGEVVMWLFNEHSVWIEVYYDNSRNEFYTVLNGEELKFASPTEAYETAIEHVLTHLKTKQK